MTAQIPDELILDERKHNMCSEPLEVLFTLLRKRPEFGLASTACWRGYYGRWEVIDDRLYLVDIRGNLGDGQPVTLETLFPGFPRRVFAHWYTGIVRIPIGDMLEYAHGGYESMFEKDLFVRFERGMLMELRVRDNRSEREDRFANHVPPDRREFTPGKDDLVQELSVAEIEAGAIVTDPLSAVPPLPFGHLNVGWKRLLARAPQDSRIWSFRAGGASGRNLREGYARVTRGRIRAYFLTADHRVEQMPEGRRWYRDI
jgi:hypothetical protein